MATSTNYRVIDLFAGMGGIRLGFEPLGIDCVFTSEWDEDAQLMYKANFGEMPQGDITKIDPLDIPDHDILLAGFPCQPFSILGSNGGFFDTRGTLFFNIEEILRIKKPYAFLLENVKGLKSHDKGKTFKVIMETLKNIGYFVSETVLNTLDFGLPQKRERTFIVGFREDLAFTFPKKTGLVPSLNDVLEPDDLVPDSSFATEYIQEKRIKALKKPAPQPSVWHENKSGNVSALPYSCALRSGASHSYLLVNGKRHFTSRELLRLQGFPESFKIVVSLPKVRKLAGNAVSVPVIKAIAIQMDDAMKNKKIRAKQEKLFGAKKI